MVGTFRVGTYYYPEQWPREQWSRDLDNIAAMGMRIVHMGEFAWFSLEPEPGRFKLDWLADVVDMAADRGLAVILCTPTAAPPIWLGERFPETLPVENGRVRGFGGRRHYSPTSPALRDATVRIVTAMAERFGNHPAVIGWQIDNEYGGGFTTNDHTHAAFQDWLRRQYGTLIALNNAWGCRFWNTQYTAFEQVRMPAARELTYDNPHHHLDASRFWSWAWADFNAVQAQVLRRHVGDRFITTNFMPLYSELDPADLAGELSLFSWDSYPVSGLGKSDGQEFRLADPDGMGLVHDHMAGFTGRWALMELQPGQINWSGVPCRPLPGAVRLWIWTAIAHGAEFVTTYRYRQPLFGTELFHDGLVGTDGVTPSVGGREFAQVAAEVRDLDLASTSDGGPAIGFLLDFEQMWQAAVLPQAKAWSHPTLLRTWYAAVARLGLPVRVVRPGQPLPSGLAVLVAAGLQMVDDGLIDSLTTYATAGGHLVVTARTGLMDRRGHLWDGPWAMPIRSLIGADVTGYDALPADVVGAVGFGDQSFEWNVWGDHLDPHAGTEVLGRYTDQFYAGTAAVTRVCRGPGSVTYCGVFGPAGMANAIVEQVAATAGLSVKPLPLRVRVRRRGRYTVALNYADREHPTPAPAGARFVVGGPTLPPAGVAVWT